MSSTKRFLLWLLVSGLLWGMLSGVFVFSGGNFGDAVDSRLEALLPGTPDADTDGDRYMDSLAREIVFMVSWPEKDRTLASKADEEGGRIFALAQGVSQGDTLFAPAGNSLTKEMKRFVWEHRYSFPAPPYVNSDALTQNNARKALKDEVISALYNPFGGITAAELEHDPFMAVRHVAMSLGAGFSLSQGGFPLKDTKDGMRHLLVQLYMKRAASGDEAQALLEVARSWQESCPDGLSCAYTGPLFFAQSSEEASTTDLSRIGIASTVVLVLLFAMVFRSWRELSFATIMLAGALFTGVLTVLACTGKIHAATLGMGGTLCGICADYAVHVFMHAGPNISAGELRQQLRRPLFWSLTTSLMAYVILALTGLLVLQQLALLATAALIYSWATVMFVFSGFNVRGPASPHLGRLFAGFLRSIPLPLRTGIALVMIAFGGWIFVTVPPDDDCASMQERSGALTTMNEEVLQALGGGPVSAFYMIKGKDTEEALARCEELLARPEFAAVFMPCRMLPSAAKQRERIALYQSLFPVLSEALKDEGITVTMEASGLSSPPVFAVQDFPGELKEFTGEHSVLVRVNAQSPAAKTLSKQEFAVSFDRRATWSQALGHMRGALEAVFPLAFIGVLLTGILCLRSRMILGMFIPLLAGLGAGVLGVYWGAQGYFSLFTVLALFMLLGLGADYCIFLGRPSEENGDANALSRGAAGVLLAFATTEAAFGALAFSGTAVISAFGMVLALGLPVIILTIPAFATSKKSAPNKG